MNGTLQRTVSQYVAFTYAIEEQNRKILHVHVLAWIKEPMELQQKLYLDIHEEIWNACKIIARKFEYVAFTQLFGLYLVKKDIWKSIRSQIYSHKLCIIKKCKICITNSLSQQLINHFYFVLIKAFRKMQGKSVLHGNWTDKSRHVWINKWQYVIIIFNIHYKPLQVDKQTSYQNFCMQNSWDSTTFFLPKWRTK